MTSADLGKNLYLDIENDTEGLIVQEVGSDSYHNRTCWLVLLGGERLLVWDDQIKQKKEVKNGDKGTC